MKVSVLFSGGKDSVYAAYLIQQQGWEVQSLMTVLPRTADSYMFHYPNIGWTRLQGEAMGIPVRTVETDAKEEKEIDDVERLMKDEDVDGFVSGAIASDYQWTRLNGVCHRLGRPLFSPLWRKDQLTLLNDMVHAGFVFLVSGVYAGGLGEKWLGRGIDRAAIAELAALRNTHGINPSGEGGEIETFVLDGPSFSRRIRVDEASKEWARDSGTYTILRASLEKK